MRRRPAHLARWSALLVGAVGILLVAVLATRQPASLVLADSPLLGRPAPAIDATSFSGRQVRLSSMRGRFVLVNFFAPWCLQCQEEAPQLEAFLYTRPGGALTGVLGVLYGDTLADGKAFQSAEGATWPSVVDPAGMIASRYGVGSLPRSFLVDPSGRIVECIVGAVTAAELDHLVLRQLRNRA
ncbi:MAG: TlpA disulfide reductase family protein [Actinomycetota bacterium]|nr:TlpA disulfide reductase family protein [Actinomycetota bacterium]